jgi:hypothetical protein
MCTKTNRGGRGKEGGVMRGSICIEVRGKGRGYGEEPTPLRRSSTEPFENRYFRLFDA